MPIIVSYARSVNQKVEINSEIHPLFVNRQVSFAKTQYQKDLIQQPQHWRAKITAKK